MMGGTCLWICHTGELVVAIYLSHHFGVTDVGDVILPDVSMKPIVEVEEAVIQRNQDV